ncbi:hypothetical protein [Legionella parisiensis]|uniref:Uncharacterized protein n=1 Tax=Legionella parisiensis TaxID=45071 RepID=A0A1E5JNC1_9GAMM|nr:hypothetical protein [Legionella parisiensis]KTD42877.1 hypothetical protein Lpar_0854 [Legionella parisiensis]OEH46002.1 hypothetical protein lpari_03054 [Legionella parisiensis]STX78049.1 Uncharacterised protein [Legionella parisiensis]
MDKLHEDAVHINEKQWIIPLVIFIICFIVVIFAINQIIILAKPHTNLNTNKSYTPIDEEISSLINNPEILSYQMLEKKPLLNFQNGSALQTQLNILPQIKNLPPIDQNTIIRVKLVEWKIKQLQDQFNQFSTDNNEPIIFKTLFWLLSFLVWIGSIVGGKMLNFLTDRYIINKYWG